MAGRHNAVTKFVNASVSFLFLEGLFKDILKTAEAVIVANFFFSRRRHTILFLMKAHNGSSMRHSKTAAVLSGRQRLLADGIGSRRRQRLSADGGGRMTNGIFADDRGQPLGERRRTDGSQPLGRQQQLLADDIGRQRSAPWWTATVRAQLASRRTVAALGGCR